MPDCYKVQFQFYHSLFLILKVGRIVAWAEEGTEMTPQWALSGLPNSHKSHSASDANNDVQLTFGYSNLVLPGADLCGVSSRLPREEMRREHLINFGKCGGSFFYGLFKVRIHDDKQIKTFQKRVLYHSLSLFYNFRSFTVKNCC